LTDTALTAPLEPTAAERGFLHPRILIPFLLVSLIWGSTWLVIRDQISSVPASWSVTYRFSIAATGMFLLAIMMRQGLRMGRAGHFGALALGLFQFCLNFNFVYAAEHHITSGLVAVLFALLIVPNALLGKIWLGKVVTRQFWVGSVIACAGIGLLILREYRVAAMDADQVLIGTALTLAAVLCASASNVLQASARMNPFPIITVSAWAMLYGSLFNGVWSLLNYGQPVWDSRPEYLAGVVYLGLIGSVVTFPLYFGLIRSIGPGKAAYTSVIIPVIAMLLSTIFEHYQWSLLAAIGGALTMAGLLVAMQNNRTKQPESETEKSGLGAGFDSGLDMETQTVYQKL
jgi:drug/metabolite transporter (DMT)-like permease